MKKGIVFFFFFLLFDQTDFHIFFTKQSRKLLFPLAANSLSLHRDGKEAKLFLE